MEFTTEIKPTPEQIAKLIWDMYSDDQAKMFAALLKEAGSEHRLMMQFLSVRDECKLLEMAGKPEAMESFLSLFASAYKYFGV